MSCSEQTLQRNKKSRHHCHTILWKNKPNVQRNHQKCMPWRLRINRFISNNSWWRYAETWQLFLSRNQWSNSNPVSKEIARSCHVLSDVLHLLQRKRKHPFNDTELLWSENWWKQHEICHPKHRWTWQKSPVGQHNTSKWGKDVWATR